MIYQFNALNCRCKEKYCVKSRKKEQKVKTKLFFKKNHENEKKTNKSVRQVQRCKKKTQKEHGNYSI